MLKKDVTNVVDYLCWGGLLCSANRLGLYTLFTLPPPPAPHPTPGKNLPLQSTKIQGDSKLATRPCPRYTSETLPQVHKQQCCTTFPTGYQRCRIEGNHLCGFSQGPNLNGVTVS